LTITNTSGAVVAEQNFDAWGRKRNTTTWDYANVAANPTWLYRGYTGHEHLPEFNLINMNARLYDPVLGRMLSPDNYVSVGSSQGMNRYTYANNNPLKYTDPDGNWVQAVIGAVMGAYSGYQIAHSKGITGLGMAIYMFSGAAIGAISSGLGSAVSLELGKTLVASGTGGIVCGVGGLAAGALSGGAFAALSGANPLSGMLQGGLGGFFGGALGVSIGGSAGAFVGGAIAGAISSVDKDGIDLSKMAKAALRGGLMSLASHHTQQAAAYLEYRSWHPYGSPDNRNGRLLSYRQFSAISTAAQRSFARGIEFGGWLLENGDMVMWEGEATETSIKPTMPRPKGTWAEFHTHPTGGPAWFDHSSPLDMQLATPGIKQYVVGRESFWAYSARNGYKGPLVKEFSSMHFNPFPFYLNWLR
jgi:RHS repeat-associated protein